MAIRHVDNGKMPHAGPVLDRLRAVYEVETDAALAKHMGVAPSTVAHWRQRNSIPYEKCIDLAREFGVSLNWLLLGKGTELPSALGDSVDGLDRDALTLALEQYRATDTVQLLSPSAAAKMILQDYVEFTEMLADLQAFGASRADAISFVRRGIKRPRTEAGGDDS